MDHLQIVCTAVVALVLLFVAFLTFTNKETRQTNLILMAGLASLLISRLLANGWSSKLLAVAAAALILTSSITTIRYISGTKRSTE